MKTKGDKDNSKTTSAVEKNKTVTMDYNGQWNTTKNHKDSRVNEEP